MEIALLYVAGAVLLGLAGVGVGVGVGSGFVAAGTAAFFIAAVMPRSSVSRVSSPIAWTTTISST